MTVYKATWRENRFLCGFMGAFGLFAVWVGLKALLAEDKSNAATSFIAIALIIFAGLLAMRFRLRVCCTDTYLEARGLWQTRRVLWSELRAVIRLYEENYINSRIYGPTEYQFRSASGWANINFKFFSLDCLRDIIERAQQAGVTVPR